MQESVYPLVSSSIDKKDLGPQFFQAVLQFHVKMVSKGAISLFFLLYGCLITRAT